MTSNRSLTVSQQSWAVRHEGTTPCWPDWVRSMGRCTQGLSPGVTGRSSLGSPIHRLPPPRRRNYGAEWLPKPDLSSVDAVVVAAPMQFHHDIGRAVIAAGMPMLMEKPLADSYDDAVDLVQRSFAGSTPLMCGFLERFNPVVRTAMDIVDQPLHMMSARHSPYVERIRTGVASDLLIHDIDIAIRSFGSTPSSVASLSRALPSSK